MEREFTLFLRQIFGYNRCPNKFPVVPRNREAGMSQKMSSTASRYINITVGKMCPINFLFG